MSKPLVSICCITYNHEQYIRDCLEGFLMQKTDFPFEVLIHDDASTDHTADIIREYEAKYPDIIKPIYQTENQYSKGIKVGVTYNFPRAQGKYIAICEGDDYWIDPMKLQIQFDFMESNPDYSMCFHGAVVKSGETGEELSKFSDIQERDYTGYEMVEHWIVPTASAFFRRKYTSQIPVNKDFWCGDIITWLTMCKFGKIHAFAQKMSVYRILSTGAISTHNRRHDAAWLERQNRHFDALFKAFPFLSQRLKHKLKTIDYITYLRYTQSTIGTFAAIKLFLTLRLDYQICLLIRWLENRVYYLKKY